MTAQSDHRALDDEGGEAPCFMCLLDEDGLMPDPLDEDGLMPDPRDGDKPLPPTPAQSDPAADKQAHRPGEGKAAAKRQAR